MKKFELFYLHKIATKKEDNMQTVPVSELKSNLIKILKEIEHGASIDITSKGRVVAKLVPPDHAKKSARKKLSEIGRKAIIHDIISPIETKWEAEK